MPLLRKDIHAGRLSQARSWGQQAAEQPPGSGALICCWLPFLVIHFACALQSGRLNEHVRSKHADQLAAAPPADASSSSSAAAATAPVKAAAQASKAPTAAIVRDQGVAAKGAAAPGPASTRPSTAAAIAGKAGGQGAASAAGTPAVSIMDIGSRAGYYTHKSPKLQLLEWTQKEKMLKPRYSARQHEGGGFTCKVGCACGQDAHGAVQQPVLPCVCSVLFVCSAPYKTEQLLW